MFSMATVNATLAMLSGPIGFLTPQARSTLIGLIASQNRPALTRFFTQNNPILQPMRVIELVEQVLQSELGAPSTVPFEDRLRLSAVRPAANVVPVAARRVSPAINVPPVQIQVAEVSMAPTPDEFYGFETTTLAIRSGGGEFPPGGSIGGPGGAAAGGAGIAIAGRALRLIMGGGGGRLTAAIWNTLPSVVRSALIQVGIGVGALIAFNGDIPFITLPGQGPGTARSEGALPMVPQFNDGQIDVQVGRYYDGRIITNTWVANGIQFWATGSGNDRMHHVLKMDGSIKSWKPPRPVVLMPGGAKNIRDLLRADAIVDKQLKKVGAALRRRQPRQRKPKGPAQVVIVDPQHAVLH